MAINVSIVFEPIWPRIEPYLHLVKHGDPNDPQVRIEFLDVPDPLAQELVMYQMRCVSCLRPNHPLRRREGDAWDRIYYAPACALTVRMKCSRTRAVELEYHRFLGFETKPAKQLGLFGS